MAIWPKVTLGIVLAAACCSIGAMPPAAATDETRLAGEGYQLGPGDKLRITVFNEPSLTGEYGISPAGNVAFPLIGNVASSGKTLEALSEALRQKLSNYVNDPKVSVEALTYRPYYVLGEVNKPGEYPYLVGLKIEQAIATAGGYTYRANRGTAFLRRGDGREQSVKTRKQPIRVLPGDTIRIGERYL